MVAIAGQAGRPPGWAPALVRRLRGPSGLRAGWGTLPPAARVALLGLLASALVAVALGVYISIEIRRHLLDAEGRGLQAAVTAIEPSLPTTLQAGALDSEDIERLDRLIDRAFLDTDHVRVKLWSLDGVVLYSDAHDLIGQQFPDIQARIREVDAAGVLAEVTELDDAENILERNYPRLVEYYVAVRNESGAIVAVFEIYENVAFLEEALAGISRATWLAIGSGLTVLLVFLVVLVVASLRSITRDRAAAEARAAELGVLVGAAEALASSLVPSEFFARLQTRVRTALGLTRLSLQTGPPSSEAAVAHLLRDGSWLVAERETEPFAVDDVRLLRSVANSLDAALANALLYEEVRQAAQDRRSLLRKIDEAHEDERRRIVGELHDSLAGDLIRTLYGIRGIAARVPDVGSDIHAELVALESVLAQAETDLRAFLNRVRPVTVGEFGLRAALEGRVDRFRREAGIDARLNVRGDLEPSSDEVQLVLLRSLEEALLNVRKHAGATIVRVAITADASQIRLVVDDNGGGWREQAPTTGRGLGLPYMRERVVGLGGTLKTEASRLGGARLVLVIGREPPR